MTITKVTLKYCDGRIPVLVGCQDYEINLVINMYDYDCDHCIMTIAIAMTMTMNKTMNRT